MFLEFSKLLLLLQGEGLQGTSSFPLGLFSSFLGFKAILFDTEIEFRLGDITGGDGSVSFVVVLLS
jgi:hypothetical protein